MCIKYHKKDPIATAWLYFLTHTILYVNHQSNSSSAGTCEPPFGSSICHITIVSYITTGNEAQHG